MRQRPYGRAMLRFRWLADTQTSQYNSPLCDVLRQLGHRRQAAVTKG